MKIIKGRKVYTPAEINYFAKETLEQMVVWVEGEVSEIKKNPNYSFYYLTLKDGSATLPCIVNGYLVDTNGQDLLNQRVIAFGNLTLYEPIGKYQLRVQHLELSGEGDLYKKLESLIKKLKDEGLFSTASKKKIPLYPKKVCLITSKGSDAWKDFKTHSTEKFPIIELVEIDTRMQGSQSAQSMIKSISIADDQNSDVVVITRGGGSIEDLAAFNDEVVARAIFNMDTPTVVAIGHESNEFLSEWVADVRASTPTDAANVITRGWQGILEKLNFIKITLHAKREKLLDFNLQKLDFIYFKLLETKGKFKEYPHRLTASKEALKRHEGVIIAGANEAEYNAFKNLSRQSVLFLEKLDDKLQNLNHSLKILSPINTLERGYSITRDKNGRLVKSADSVVVGDMITVKLARGELATKIKSKINEKG